MKLIILDNAAQAGEWAAKYVKKRIHEFKPGPDKYFTLGLPTGMDSYNELGIQILHKDYVNNLTLIEDPT